MSYVVLARKYRPKKFSEMVGQPHVVQALGNALAQQRLHHAYLFTGTRGIGKTTVSRILAKSLNCMGADGQGGITNEPCGVCAACRDIDAGRFVDYTELDAASNRGVDEIESLLEQAVYKPVMGRFKVFMIDEVHMLTNHAFNAMLKTLEEPPEYLKFVLATTDPQKVPVTVLSRCLQFNLRPMAPETVSEHLAHVLRAEAIEAQAQALTLLGRAARGSMRDALSLTDQAIAFGGGKLEAETVGRMLGAVDRSHVFALIGAVARGDAKAILTTCDALRDNGFNAAGVLEEMVVVLQRIAVRQLAGVSSPNDEAQIAELAQALPPDETQILYKLALKGQDELAWSPDEYAGLAMVVMRALAFKPGGPSASAAGGAAEPTKKSEWPLTAPSALQAGHVPAVRAEQSLAATAPAVLRPEPAAESVRTLQPGPESPSPRGVVAALPVVEAPPVRVSLPEQANGAARPGVAQVQAVSPRAWAPEPQRVPHDLATDPRASNEAWHEIVDALDAGGHISAMARELAHQSEWIDDQPLGESATRVWTLRTMRGTLMAPAPRERVEAGLQALGHAVRLEVIAAITTDTVADRANAAKAARQAAAEDAIQNDPEIQALLARFGGTIVAGSIQPVDA